MPEIYTKNVATSVEEAAKIISRAEFRVFGQGIIDIVDEKMLLEILQKFCCP